MNTLIISCPTLKQELLAAMSRQQSRAMVYFLPARLHGDMQDILPYLQNILDNLANVDRVVLLVTGCGGSTKGLVYHQGELIIPRTHDCLDILLVDKNCQVAQRDPLGVYMTGSWYEYHMKTLLNADAQVEKLGYEKAAELMRSIFKGINQFYIIDTGCFDVQAVEQGLATLVKMLKGSIHLVPGKYGFLEKVAQGDFNEENFYILPAGTPVPILKFRLNE